MFNVILKKTKTHCTQQRCCTYGRKGKVVRKVECHNEGLEHCQPIRFKKCKIVKTDALCQRKKCCSFLKVDKIVKKIKLSLGIWWSL